MRCQHTLFSPGHHDGSTNVTFQSTSATHRPNGPLQLACGSPRLETVWLHADWPREVPRARVAASPRAHEVPHASQRHMAPRPRFDEAPSQLCGAPSPHGEQANKSKTLESPAYACRLRFPDGVDEYANALARRARSCNGLAVGMRPSLRWLQTVVRLALSMARTQRAAPDLAPRGCNGYAMRWDSPANRMLS